MERLIGDWEGLANAGGIRRVRLVNRRAVVSLAVPMDSVLLPAGALVVTGRVDLTDIAFAPGRCRLQVVHEDTVNGIKYRVELSMEVPRWSMAFQDWLGQNARTTWLAAIEDANGQCWLLGHPDSNGLEMRSTVETGGKRSEQNRVSLSFRREQSSPVLAMSGIDAYYLYPIDFSFDFSQDFFIDY